MRRVLPSVRLAALPLLLIPLILVVVATQLKLSPTVSSNLGPKPPPEADYYLRKAELSTMDLQGNLLYRVHAGNVLHYPDQSISLAEVSVDYLNGPWTLTAESGRIAPGQQTLMLSGNVYMSGTLPSGEAVELRTPSITIAFDARVIETTEQVHMSSTAVQATATGMRTDLAGQELKLLSQVKVTYEP